MKPCLENRNVKSAHVNIPFKNFGVILVHHALITKSYIDFYN